MSSLEKKTNDSFLPKLSTNTEKTSKQTIDKGEEKITKKLEKIKAAV